MPVTAVGACALAIVTTGWVYLWWVPMLIPVGLAALFSPLRLALAALMIAVVAPAFYVSTSDRAVLLALICTVVWAACWLWAGHREQQVRRAAREREVAAAQAVYDERLRIARDLHDMVSHGMSVITIQAEYGALMGRGDPAAALRALHVVEDTGHETLRQLRQMLDVLRRPTDREDPGGDTPLEPAPGLADLPDLLTRTAAAGLLVDYEPSPPHDALPAVLQLCIYRVVQEGVANVLRHSGARTARLAIERVDEQLRVTLSNGPGLRTTSPGLPAVRADVRDGTPRPGHGLSGIRERVEILGGHMEVATTADGTYTLHVVLPCAVPATASTVRT
ncbi:sensor histidine kinase [Nocardioides sp.]|uniref:sensor histidine kinase n=1 Tax=Nocardioides sp. TaxID=35761 RepID=UPI002F3FF9DB